MRKLKDFLANIAVVTTWLVVILCMLAVGFSFCKEYLKVDKIDSNWVVAISTFLATLAAVIFGVFGDRIKSFFSPKPNIIIDSNILKTRQQYVEFPASEQNQYSNKMNELEIYRLVLKNESNVNAEGVVVDLVEISDNGKPRGIVPTPLQWTHLNSFSRSIAPGQNVYLDFIQSCQKFDQKHPTSFVAPLLYLNPSMINLISNCRVKLICYGDNMPPKEFVLEVVYRFNKNQFPTIEIKIL